MYTTLLFRNCWKQQAPPAKRLWRLVAVMNETSLGYHPSTWITPICTYNFKNKRKTHCILESTIHKDLFVEGQWQTKISPSPSPFWASVSLLPLSLPNVNLSRCSLGLWSLILFYSLVSESNLDKWVCLWVGRHRIRFSLFKSSSTRFQLAASSLQLPLASLSGKELS